MENSWTEKGWTDVFYQSYQWISPSNQVRRVDKATADALLVLEI